MGRGGWGPLPTRSHLLLVDRCSWEPTLPIFVGCSQYLLFCSFRQLGGFLQGLRPQAPPADVHRDHGDSFLPAPGSKVSGKDPGWPD